MNAYGPTVTSSVTVDAGSSSTYTIDFEVTTSFPPSIYDNGSTAQDPFRAQITYYNGESYTTETVTFPPTGGSYSITVGRGIEGSISNISVSLNSMTGGSLVQGVDVSGQGLEFEYPLGSEPSDTSGDGSFADWYSGLLGALSDFGDQLSAAMFDALAPNIQGALEKFAASSMLSSPLIIDLDHSGTIDLVSLSASQAFFDIDEDGFAEKTGWVGPTDGLLVWDRNGDDVINDSSELFGSKSEDGFVELRAMDTNLDGKIDASDADWNKLQIWVDSNSDGITQAQELHTLDEFGITSIDTANVRVDQDVDGNIITNDGSLTYADGSIGDIVDVWFSYDETRTIYNLDYTLDERTLFLPNLRGYGELPDLYIAMSIDNGAGGLLEMVQGLAGKNIAELFDGGDLHEQVREILFAWAGVENINPASRGPNVDARELAFLETLLGQDFLQRGYMSNPAPQAGKALNEAFDSTLDELTARFLLQTEAGTLLENAKYN